MFLPELMPAQEDALRPGGREELGSELGEVRWFGVRGHIGGQSLGVTQ